MTLRLILILVSALMSNAATYYVDYSTGVDSANGTSTSTPWKHCPGDNTATSVAASTSLAAGDTVVFKGGVSYLITNAIIAPNWSGVLNTPITYDGNSSGAWGTGKAIITDNHDPSGSAAFFTSAFRSNLIFRSFNIKEIGGSATLPTDGGSAIAANAGYGILMQGGGQNITIQDCDFSELGYYFNQKPMGGITSTDSIQGVGIQFYGANTKHLNLLITNCTFSRVSAAIQITSSSGGTTNAEIANCTFTDSIRWCVDLPITSTSAKVDFLSIHDCTFYNYTQLTYWSGYGEGPHVDGIFDRCDYDSATYGTNRNFYNNLFWSTIGSGAGGTAQIYLTAGPSANMWNNVFIGSGMPNGNIQSADGRRTGGSLDYINIFNNTFYDSDHVAIRIITEADWPPVHKLRVENNIFYDALVGSGANDLIWLDPGTDQNESWMSTNWWFNHNIYKSFNWSAQYIRFKGGWWYFTDMRSIGWEASGSTNSPLFMDISSGFANTPNQDLRPQLTSPAVNAGTNLSGLFTEDITGVSRPQGAAWDIGAYEFQVPVPPAVTISGHVSFSGNVKLSSQ